MRKFRHGLLAGVVSGLLLAAFWARPTPPPAEAQGVGIFSRTLCSTLTGVVSGQTFCFEQSTNTLKFWTGSAWVQATSSQGGFVNIRDYGAVGDGSTNDAPAVQLAINAATASGLNSVILVPPTATSYRIATALTNVGQVTFLYAGIGDFSGPAAPGTANKVQFTPSVGGTATMYVQDNSGQDAIQGVANGGGIAGHFAVNSGAGIAVSGSSVSTTQPAINGSSTGFYGGLFFNITNLGSDVLNANAIGLVGQSVYSNAGYFQQGAVSGAGSTLAANNAYPGLYMTRVVGSLNGFNYTAPLFRVDDTTISTGPLAVFARQGAFGASGIATVGIINSDGSSAFGTAAVLNGSFHHLEGNVQNAGLIVFNNNGPSIGADSVSTPLWIGGRNAAGTIGNVSIEALTNTAAAPDMLIRSGSSGNKVGNGTQQIVVKNTGGVIIGSLSNTARGTGTLVVASATYANAQAAIVASASGPNLQNIVAISGTGTAGRNLRGTCTFAAATTCSVSFANNEPDASYFVALGPQAAAAANVHPYGISKLASGFTITATVSNSNAVDWIIVR